MNYKIKTLILFNHVATIIALMYGDLWFLFGSIIAFLLINKLGGEIGLHRYFCHRSFTTSKFWHYAMLTTASLNCFGPPIAWVGVHRKHHKEADTSDDPHGKQAVWRVWLTAWKPFQIDIKYIKDMLRDKDQMFVYKYYFWLIGFAWLSLFFINWQIPIFLISLPSVISFHLAGLVNTVCHMTGDKPHETKDNSYNNKWVNMITLGSGLHNTHHAFPTSWDNRKKSGDIDLPAVIIKNILIRK
jgi:stearoyl-CoA desaturase (delta-9 desaturase)